MSEQSEVTGPENCPEREYHGKPFRYCPVKGCGWTEAVPVVAAMTVSLDELMDLGDLAKYRFWGHFDAVLAQALAADQRGPLPTLKGGKVTITVTLDAH